ncbi:T9SS type A sorting domain-containing protein [Brumimicrobium oceani]|uniref:Secretion system C-terminal sorting domain-containing protein n=1 Tax=Brumimicrobium oceani TaxID=2100725 RepID=A0A2U2XBI5_9FLAO|nr:T9SS type A sorting domain-containing protein [Brumimicrobium oceani]PWH85127.1 hypothetical protein DIT68_10855 [Brumimicrobium oceani]
MNGRNPDGSFWTHGITGATAQYLYDGVPGLGTDWTEMNIDGNGTANPMGDRRFIATSIEETFNPGDTLVYNYAIIVNRQGDHLENVQGLIEYADSVQNYFDANNTDCSSNINVGLTQELEIGNLNLFPNPATNQVQITWEDMNFKEIIITSYQGKLIKKVLVNNTKGKKTVDLNQLSSGVYFVRMGNYAQKLIVK